MKKLKQKTKNPDRNQFILDEINQLIGKKILIRLNHDSNLGKFEIEGILQKEKNFFQIYNNLNITHWGRIRFTENKVINIQQINNKIVMDLHFTGINYKELNEKLRERTGIINSLINQVDNYSWIFMEDEISSDRVNLEFEGKKYLINRMEIYDILHYDSKRKIYYVVRPKKYVLEFYEKSVNYVNYNGQIWINF